MSDLENKIELSIESACKVRDKIVRGREFLPNDIYYQALDFVDYALRDLDETLNSKKGRDFAILSMDCVDLISFDFKIEHALSKFILSKQFCKKGSVDGFCMQVPGTPVSSILFDVEVSSSSKASICS